MANKSGDTIHEDFGHGTTTPSHDGRTARKGLDHDHPEWLGPVDGKQQGGGVSQERVLISLANFANKFYVRRVQQSSDRVVVLLVRSVDFGGNFQLLSTTPRYFDRPIDALFRRNPP